MLTANEHVQNYFLITSEIRKYEIISGTNNTVEANQSVNEHKSGFETD